MLSLYIKEKTPVLFRGKNMEFGADAEIFMARKKDKILIACNVNQ